MTNRAEELLHEAQGYLARGEEFYRKAAEKMRGAKEDGATWVEIADSLGRSITWVKDIIGWQETPANRGRYTGGLPFAEDKGAVAKRHARSVLRDMPAEEIAETYLADPDVREKVNQAQAIATETFQRRGEERQRQADRASREDIGADVTDDLAHSQHLRDAEHELVRARSALAGFLKRANSLEGDRPDMWVNHCRDWLDDISEKVDLARGLLDGSNVDDAIDQILAGEI